jgi:hypothetical protein
MISLLNTCNNCRGESLFIVGRGLCSKCYRNKKIRAQYPAVVIRDSNRSTAAANGTVPSDWLENYLLLDREMQIEEIEPGTLPCIACDATVKVDDFDRETAIRVRCPWSICKACKERKGKA